jgi:hypothetical protein
MDKVVDEDTVVNDGSGALDLRAMLDLIWLLRVLTATWQGLRRWWNERRQRTRTHGPQRLPAAG